MVRKHILFTGALVIFVFLFAFVGFTAAEEDIRRISKEDVKELIGTPGVTIIDVRYQNTWKKSDTKIAGAVREHPNEIGSWVAKYDKNSTIILYCD